MSPTADAVDGPPLDAADLGEVAARLRTSGVLALALGRPDGEGWVDLPTAVGEVPRWHAQLAAVRGDARAAAAFLADWIASTPALVIGLPAIIADVVPTPALPELALHRTAGIVDGHAIDARHAGTARHAAVDDALDLAADTIAALTDPVVVALCDQLPVGIAPVWGGVADTLAAYVLWFGRETGVGTGRLWARTERLVDRLTAITALRTRPRLMPVRWSGGTDDYATRGTCCLYYRTCGADTPTELRYCSTCPLRDEEERTARLVRYLEATHGGGS